MRQPSQKAMEKRVERAYYAGCSGVQINIMDISKVFKAGVAAIVAQPEISDADLTVKFRAIVDAINLGVAA